MLVIDPPAAALRGTEVPLDLEAGRPALVLSAQPGRRLRLVLDSAAEDLVLFGDAAARVRVERLVGLATLTGGRRAGVGAAPRLHQLPRPPRRALLAPDVDGRGEDGLLPLAAVGRIALDWARGVAVLAPR